MVPSNRAPVITAGPQAAPNPVTLPATTTVSVTASDADGDALTYAWSRVLGPGTASFTNAAAASTTVAFSAAGSYTLKVTVSDGKATVSGNVNVSVLSSNHVPVITAGPQAAPNPVTLPATTNVSVTASDADADPLTYAWSKTTGPGTASFTNAAAASTTVAFSAAGSYTLKVTVSDGKATVSGSLDMTVTPALPIPDIDGDGDVDGSDMHLFMLTFGKASGSPGFDARCDFDLNGVVNATDLGIFTGEYENQSPERD